MSLELVAGWNVTTAPSGAEGIRGADERPDGILLDVMMPELDGPATLAELRQDDTVGTTPVIFLTAKVQAAERTRFAGARRRRAHRQAVRSDEAVRADRRAVRLVAVTEGGDRDAMRAALAGALAGPPRRRSMPSSAILRRGRGRTVAGHVTAGAARRPPARRVARDVRPGRRDAARPPARELLRGRDGARPDADRRRPRSSSSSRRSWLRSTARHPPAMRPRRRPCHRDEIDADRRRSSASASHWPPRSPRPRPPAVPRRSPSTTRRARRPWPAAAPSTPS